MVERSHFENAEEMIDSFFQAEDDQGDEREEMKKGEWLTPYSSLDWIKRVHEQENIGREKPQPWEENQQVRKLLDDEMFRNFRSLSIDGKRAIKLRDMDVDQVTGVIEEQVLRLKELDFDPDDGPYVGLSNDRAGRDQHFDLIKEDLPELLEANKELRVKEADINSSFDWEFVQGEVKKILQDSSLADEYETRVALGLISKAVIANLRRLWPEAGQDETRELLQINPHQALDYIEIGISRAQEEDFDPEDARTTRGMDSKEDRDNRLEELSREVASLLIANKFLQQGKAATEIQVENPAA